MTFIQSTPPPSASSWEHTAPLLQTVLWVTLISFVLIRYHRHMSGLLSALQTRIETGSGVELGPVKLSELKPLEPSAQKEKAAEEIKDALASNRQDSPRHTDAANLREQIEQQSALLPPAKVAQTYFQAEDLALRAIQHEYKAVVNRQMTLGNSGVGLDGAFVVNNRLHVVEVKYIPNIVDSENIQESVYRVNRAMKEKGWHNVQIILALVFESEQQIENGKVVIEKFTSGDLLVPLEVRTYAIGTLRKKFGAAADEEHTE